MIDGVGVRLGPLCDRLLKPHASHLIRQGIDPVRASRQLGHARPSVTLDIYAHEFEEARGRDDIADKLGAAFAGLLSAKSDHI